MATFDEFCLHYDLDADAPDSQLQFEQYAEAKELMLVIVGAKESPNSRLIEPGQDNNQHHNNRRYMDARLR